MYKIDLELCTGCEECLDACPEAAIVVVNSKATIDSEKCRVCGVCIQVCPTGAIYQEDPPTKITPPQEEPNFPSSKMGGGGGMGRSRGRGFRKGPRDGRGRGMGGGCRK
ncbi:MAG: 4Fe-4S binding protein [Elusimicrobia bacterium]|nr:4Fe-4S binding protein [Elusimicrobiota bacterium]